MSKVVIGKSGEHNVSIDLDRLLATRLLIQADSGGGKSWLLRRLAEQLFGKVQLIIVDPEGEFASLREKFGLILVGKGGETPADPRSAALVAHKLLELRASAVCDIYEMKHHERHAWVKNFLESLTNIPKNLWGRQVVVIVDESHVFCPEHGKGESEAYGAMVDLCTRGRKRGHCAVFATQRLGQLSKDASSQLQNRLIGPTFEDINRKRAAEVLGVLKSEEREFFKEIQLLEPGNFFALGRAISTERILVHVGSVETTHPEAGSSKHASEPPPTPEAVAALLPKLSDLPKEAEEKAKNEAELRKEIRSLKAQLRAAPAPTEIVKADPTAIRRRDAEWKQSLDSAVRANVTMWKNGQKLLAGIKSLAELASSVLTVPLPEIQVPQFSGAEIHKGGAVKHGVSRGNLEPTPRPIATSHAETNGNLSRPQNAILKAIAEFEAIGRTQISKSWIAARSGASYTSGAYANNLGSLRSGGYIEYPAANMVALTEKGRGAAGTIEPPSSSEEMLESCLNLLSRPQQEILRVLYREHPKAVDKADLAAAAGASASSGAFANNLGSMRSAGMIEYPQPGMAKCADWLFLD